MDLPHVGQGVLIVSHRAQRSSSSVVQSTFAVQPLTENKPNAERLRVYRRQSNIVGQLRRQSTLLSNPAEFARNVSTENCNLGERSTVTIMSDNKMRDSEKSGEAVEHVYNCVQLKGTPQQRLCMTSRESIFCLLMMNKVAI